MRLAFGWRIGYSMLTTSDEENTFKEFKKKYVYHILFITLTPCFVSVLDKTQGATETDDLVCKQAWVKSQLALLIG